MNDKFKHFTACFLITTVGFFTGSGFAGVYAATLCAILREYDSYCYGKFNRKDSALDLIADALGIGFALLIKQILEVLA